MTHGYEEFFEEKKMLRLCKVDSTRPAAGLT